MELVIIFSTITAFFGHYLTEKGRLANAASSIIATLMTWLFVSFQAGRFDVVSVVELLVVFAIALVVSMVVGLIFVEHKRCSK